MYLISTAPINPDLWSTMPLYLAFPTTKPSLWTQTSDLSLPRKHHARYTRTLKQIGLPSGKKWKISLEDTSSHYRPSLLKKAGQYLKPNASQPSTSRCRRKWPVPDNISSGSPQRSEESDKEETEAVQQGRENKKVKTLGHVPLPQARHR